VERSDGEHQKCKTSLDINDARDDGVLGCSGISWTICKQSAPRSRQITTPASHHSIFTRRMLFLTPNQQCQSTEDSKAQSSVDIKTFIHWQHLRSAGCHQLFIPQLRRSMFGCRAFSLAGPEAWNSLPDYLGGPPRSFDSFRRDLKTFVSGFTSVHSTLQALRLCAT